MTTPMEFDAETAARFASLALANVEREYPHKLDHVMRSDADVRSPRALHPAFHGSFDWHSCVHMHWLLARVRRLHPALPVCADIEHTFDRHFAPAAIAAEVEYLRPAEAQAFERTYGWAWFLKLADELARSDDAAARRWSAALAPLAAALVSRYLDYLPRARYPWRYGLHANSAFALSFALDYARGRGLPALEVLCSAKARGWFGADRDAPAGWEPSGADFLSPALIEAELMRRLEPGPAYADWLARFLPAFVLRSPAELFDPVLVDDRSDGHIVHLDGLNLSRAWCLRGIASSLPQGDPRIAVAEDAARAHLDAGFEGLASDDYVGAHWLATFATLALTAGRNDC